MFIVLVEDNAVTYPFEQELAHLIVNLNSHVGYSTEGLIVEIGLLGCMVTIL